MQSVVRGGIAALVGVLMAAPLAQAKRPAPPSVTDRAAKAASVVVGKVTKIEDKAVKTDAGEMAVAVVKVEAGSGPAKSLTVVKVGFSGDQLAQGDEYCLFLEKVKGQDFYAAPDPFGLLRKTDGNWDHHVKAAKRCIAVLNQDPVKALKSKDAGDRLLAAAMLVGKHRPARMYSEKLADIDGEESKLILEALADADWSKHDDVTGVGAQQLFFRLGISEADGWKQPEDFQQLNAAAKAWLKANAGKYKVKKFVFEKK